MDNGVTNRMCMCVCLVVLFVRKWCLSAWLAILGLLFERYIQWSDEIQEAFKGTV